MLAISLHRFQKLITLFLSLILITLLLTHAFLRFFYEEWKADKYPSKNDSTRSVGRKLVPFYPTFSPEVPAYLKLDEKPSLCHRARLRFDLCRNNSSLHVRKLSNSAARNFCPGFTDCRRHILLD